MGTGRGEDRRAFLQASAAAALGTVWGGGRVTAGAPALVVAEGARPIATGGVQVGDVTSGRAVIWSRADRRARLVVEYSTTESFRSPRRVVGPTAVAETAFTARVDLAGLPPGEQIFYRVTFEDAAAPRLASVPVSGRFRTAPIAPRDVMLAWGGDIAGQGWGIDTERGGMKVFEAMRAVGPDLFIQSGDQIYADTPIVPEVRLEDGTTWRNVVTPEKSRVAESLADFRGNFSYNLLDANLLRFNAEVPVIVQWDDHEVFNNWFPGMTIDEDPRYHEKDASLLASRARRALFEFSPIRAAAGQRIYRSIPYGPSLEVFVLDARSYRGRNGANREARPDPATALLGPEQVAWLEEALLRSRATWKVIASDLPIGLIVSYAPKRLGQPIYESWSNGDDGPPLGREHEVAALLRFIRDRRIRNTVWLTADVHYAAAHHYHPDRAAFREFAPFWEFVAGPLHAGTFGPAELDRTFGPEVRFHALPPGMKQNRPPSDGLQFFGTAAIQARTGVVTVRLHDLSGRVLHTVELEPQRS